MANPDANLSWQIGDVRITRIVEREVSMPPSGLLPEATPDALAPHTSWLVPHFLEDPDGACTMKLSIHGLLVESRGRRILVDTCASDKEVKGFELLIGPSSFLEDLEAAGFPPDSIDTVLCTHLHFDHVGWNTRRENDRWVPSFPNARYLFARAEYEHWTRDGSDPTFTPTFREAVQPIVDAGLSDLVETDHVLTDEVCLEATPGHTPGHVCVRIASGGRQAVITGDLTHHPVQWAEPHWKMHADTDSAQAARTRLRLIDEHGDRDTLVIGTHYAAPCAGRIVRQDGGWRFVV